MSWNANLTAEQETAASYAGKHARLLAGPGTGKTFTMTRRILYLLSDKQVQPEEILALTFTRAAVAELKQRLAPELNEETAKKLRISTLHSFALRQLLRNASRTMLPQPLRIADDWEERNIVIEELKNLLGKSVKETTDLFDQLSADWQKLAADRSDWQRTFPDPQFLGAWQEQRSVYGYTLRAELVYQLKTALDAGGIDLEGPLRHVLVDEYQDLNPCDLAVVHSLASNGSEIYAAGDDDQSIYGFRYADPEGIRRFDKEFTPSEGLFLTECQRCDDRILQYGLYVARQDTRRKDKPLKATSPASGEVRILRFQNQGYEAATIASICKWLLKRKGLKPESILILLRSDRNRVFSDPLRAALFSDGIPVGVTSNPLEPLNSVEGRHLLGILRLVLNIRDHFAWRTLLEVRDNGLGTNTFQKLFELARKNGWNYSRSLEETANNPSLISGKGTPVTQEFTTIKQFVTSLGSPPQTGVVQWIEALAQSIISDKNTRDSILEVFLNVAITASVDSLDGLLKALNVSLGNFEQERPKEVVSIMTMHQAKGLTADAVIIVAAEDEYIPGRATGDLLDDERRFLYVSITRAKHFLYSTYALNRTGQQKHTGRTAGNTSRNLTTFLRGGPILPEDGIKYISTLK